MFLFFLERLQSLLLDLKKSLLFLLLLKPKKFLFFRRCKVHQLRWRRLLLTRLHRLLVTVRLTMMLVQITLSHKLLTMREVFVMITQIGSGYRISRRNQRRFDDVHRIMVWGFHVCLWQQWCQESWMTHQDDDRRGNTRRTNWQIQSRDQNKSSSFLIAFFISKLSLWYDDVIFSPTRNKQRQGMTQRRRIQVEEVSWEEREGGMTSRLTWVSSQVFQSENKHSQKIRCRSLRKRTHRLK